jgi:hypothetical protein
MFIKATTFSIAPTLCIAETLIFMTNSFHLIVLIKHGLIWDPDSLIEKHMIIHSMTQ